MTTARPMMFNFFIMDTPSHVSPGLWRHPESRAVEYNSLRWWLDLAKLAEAGRMDAIFIADVFGLYAEFGGSWRMLTEHAVQFPTSDPSVVLSAMASVTEHLGFVYTSSVLQQHPFPFARAASTLDHLTGGRIGWNVVTSFSANGSRSMGLEALTDHDARYRWADEYVEVTYKLWEGSWEDGAALHDRVSGRYADGDRIHKIDHVGPRYRVEGPHLVEPSPQRTPVMFMAGASEAGQAFGARNAEGVFMISGAPDASARKIDAIRQAARAAGRRTDDITFIEGLTFVVGSTEEEAARKDAEMDEWLDVEAQMAMTSGTSGVDWSQYDPDEKLVDIIEHIPGLRGSVRQVIDSMPPGRDAEKVADMMTFSIKRWRVVGTPESIADRIQQFRDVGVEGINIMYLLMPGSYVDFIEQVAPVLQDRGMMQREYAPGTLRESSSPGRGPRLEPPHPATTFRYGGPGFPREVATR